MLPKRITLPQKKCYRRWHDATATSLIISFKVGSFLHSPGSDENDFGLGAKPGDYHRCFDLLELTPDLLAVECREDISFLPREADLQ